MDDVLCVSVVVVELASSVTGSSCGCCCCCCCRSERLCAGFAAEVSMLGGSCFEVEPTLLAARSVPLAMLVSRSPMLELDEKVESRLLKIGFVFSLPSSMKAGASAMSLTTWSVARSLVDGGLLRFRSSRRGLHQQ